MHMYLFRANINCTDCKKNQKMNSIELFEFIALQVCISSNSVDWSQLFLTCWQS